MDAEPQSKQISGSDEMQNQLSPKPQSNSMEVEGQILDLPSSGRTPRRMLNQVSEFMKILQQILQAAEAHLRK